MTEKFDTSFNGLPSYSESTSTSLNSTPTLPTHVARARSVLISTLVTTQIIPCLHSNVLSGVSSTTLLMVPSNVSQLQPPQSNIAGPTGSWASEAALSQETVVGFPTAENPTLVRLQGQENSLGFWCQPAVVLELNQQLCSQLQQDGYRVVGGNTSQRSMSNVEWRTIAKKPLATGEATIEVGMGEISLRIENAMGLYETRTGKAVVVKVEIGG